MKKIITVALAVLSFTLVGTIDAKRLKPKTTTQRQSIPNRKSIPITRNEKNILEDTQQLKKATSRQKKVAATKELATDLSKDPYSLSKLEELKIKKEIKEKEEEIEELEGEEREQALMEKEELEGQLSMVQEQLKKYDETQPQEVSKLKNWALYTLLAGIGIAATYVLVTKSTVGEKIGPMASSAWSYVPSASDILEKTKMAIGYGGAVAGYGLTLFQIKDFINRLSDKLSEEQSKSNPDQEKINELENQIAELRVAAQKKQ